MKRLVLLTLFLSLLGSSGYCQETRDTSNLITIVSPNRDTLIIKDSPIGRDLYSIWMNDPTYDRKTPVIIMTASITPYLSIYNRTTTAKKHSRRKK